MGEAFAVEASYLFRSNATDVLGKAALAAERLAVGVEEATKTVRGLNSALAGMARIAGNAQSSIRGLGATLRSVSTGIDRVAAVTDAAGTQMASGFARMDASANQSAAAIDVATANMRARIASVGAAANASTAAIRGMGAAARAPVGAPPGGGAPPPVPPVAAAAGAGAFGRGAATVANGVGTAGALGALALVVGGIRGAADMQNATVQAAIATGNLGKNYDQTERNMKPLTDVAYKMAGMTGQSAVDSMNVVSTMAASGISQRQIQTLYKPIAQLADVLHFGKDKMDFTEAARMSAGLVHDLRLFKDSDLQSGFNRLAQVGFASPHGMQQLATQIRLFAPQFENFLSTNPNLKDAQGKPISANAQKATQIIDTTAWLDRIGALNRGGSGIQMLAQYLQRPKTKNQVLAEEDLGIIDRKSGRNVYRDQKTGQFRFFDLLNDVMKRYKDAPDTPGGRGKILDDLNAFSANASRVFQSLVTPEALQARENLQRQLKKEPNLDQIQTQLMGNLTQQLALLKTNVASLATTLGGPFIKPLTNFVHALADAAGRLNNFLRAHPEENKIAAGVLGVVAVAGAYKLFKMVGGIAAFAHVAAHEAKSSLGVGAGVYLSRAGHGASGAAKAVGAAAGVAARVSPIARVVKIGAVLTGLDLLPSIMKLGAPLRELGQLFASFGLKTLVTKGGLELLGGVLARIGLKFVPIIGNALFLIDTLKFVASHLTDISFWIGKASRWIHDQGWPMLSSAIVSAFWSAIHNVCQAVPAMFGFLGDTIKNSIAGALAQIGINIPGFGDNTKGLQGLEQRLGAGLAAEYARDKASFDAGYGPTGGPVYDPRFVNSLQSGQKPTKTSSVTVQGNVVVQGVQNPKDFAAALHAGDYSRQNALAGASPVSPFIAPALSTGLGR